jgi:outer membrane protein assembly factor BamE
MNRSYRRPVWAWCVCSTIHGGVEVLQIGQPMHSHLPVSPFRHAGVRRLALCVWLPVVAASQSACSGLAGKIPDVTSVVSPYRIDIQQGNVVTREQAQALKPGMPRSQVRDLLGSPLLTSVFHADRWDYVFTFRRQGQPLQQRRLALFFKGDVLDRVEADELPTEAEFVSSLDARQAGDKPPVLEATDEQLKVFQARNAVASPVTPAPPAATGTAPVAYPPLESTGASR